MILVVGATGNLGGTIARTLLAQRNPVRILVRPQSNYQPLVEAGAQPVFGDLKDEQSLQAACEGIDTLISTANSARRGGEDNVETVDLYGNRRLIVAARESWVRHLIFVSASIAHPNHPIPFLAAKGKTEVNLRASGVPYTILAPTMFAEVWPQMVVGTPAAAGRPVTLVGSATRKHAFISAADVAAFAVAAVNNPAAVNRRLAVCGPEAYSYREVIAIYERLLNCDLEVQFVAPGEPVWGLNQTGADLLALQDTYDSSWDMVETARSLSVRLTPLEDVLRRVLAPATAQATILNPLQDSTVRMAHSGSSWPNPSPERVQNTLSSSLGASILREDPLGMTSGLRRTFLERDRGVHRRRCTH